MEGLAGNKRAYSVEEVSNVTTLSKAFIRLEIKRKKLKSKNFGRRVLIMADDLDSYLNQENENFKAISDAAETAK